MRVSGPGGHTVHRRCITASGTAAEAARRPSYASRGQRASASVSDDRLASVAATLQ